MAERPKINEVGMDGFSKVKPITEGYVVKGAINATSLITKRPLPPVAIRPASSASATSATPKPPAEPK